jgi:hypothetical protein
MPVSRTVRGTAKILRCSGMSLAASAFAGPAITWCVISTQRRWQALRVEPGILADNGHPLTAGVQRRPSTDDPELCWWLVKQSGARHS